MSSSNEDKKQAALSKLDSLLDANTASNRSVAQRIRERRRERQETLTKGTVFRRDRVDGTARDDAEVDEAERRAFQLSYAEVKLASSEGSSDDKSSASDDSDTTNGSSGPGGDVAMMPRGSNAEILSASTNQNRVAGHNGDTPGQSARTQA